MLELQPFESRKMISESLPRLWTDWCMYQGSRTEPQDTEYQQMLQDVNLLYLGVRVLILLDSSYMSRFWTQVRGVACKHCAPPTYARAHCKRRGRSQFEAWCSLQLTSPSGQTKGICSEHRCEVRCIHAASETPEHFREALIGKWLKKTPTEAHEVLSSPDVTATLQCDKDVQLPKLLGLDDAVRQTLPSVRWFDLPPTQNDATSSLRIHRYGSGVLADVHEPVNVVAVCGKLRSGKSFLLNSLLAAEVFGVSPQASSYTQGVHISSKLLPSFGGVNVQGNKLAFVDMEGQGDKGLSYDLKLSTPVLLISKVVLFNVVVSLIQPSPD